LRLNQTSQDDQFATEKETGGVKRSRKVVVSIPIYQTELLFMSLGSKYKLKIK